MSGLQHEVARHEARHIGDEDREVRQPIASDIPLDQEVGPGGRHIELARVMGEGGRPDKREIRLPGASVLASIA